MAPLLDIAIPPERLPRLRLADLQRRQLAAMVDWGAAGARVQPLVLVLEDLKWFDPTLIDLIHTLSERGAKAPILILATARPEFRPPWSLRPHHTVISLAPLNEAQVQRMVTELASRQALPAEVVKGVRERRRRCTAIRRRGDAHFSSEVSKEARRQSLQPGQSLAARIDRLGSAREIAQVGSVLGRSFSYRLLRDIAFKHLLATAAPRARGCRRGQSPDPR